MKIAVVPARGGSKRIPRKNIRLFEGKPIIAWSIEAALAAGCFDRVIVSTDDADIAAVARQYGAEVPFLRPTELADDYAGTAEVVRHVISALSVQGGAAVSAACCIYATAPFIAAQDLCQGFALLTAPSAEPKLQGEQHAQDYALAVTEFEFPIQRAVAVDDALQLQMLTPEYAGVRSQDLAKAYHDAGQFCWGTANAWLQAKPVYSSATAAVVIPRYRVQDIDNEEDWHRAELMFRASKL